MVINVVMATVAAAAAVTTDVVRPSLLNSLPEEGLHMESKLRCV